ACGQCGGTLHVRSRAHGRRRFFYYACSTANLKGKSLCGNFLRLPLDVADEAVLSAIETDFLHPAVVAPAVEQAHGALASTAPETTNQVAAVEANLERLGAELARLVEAVRHGGALLPHRRDPAARDREESPRDAADGLALAGASACGRRSPRGNRAGA